MMYLVVMKNDVPGWHFEATDKVEDYKLDEYVTDAKGRWDEVTYTELPD